MAMRDSSSILKAGATVPAKFRVCDAAGNSIGAPGVVMAFKLVELMGGPAGEVDETLDSTTADTAFRRDSKAQQWIFNISTKSLTAKWGIYRRRSTVSHD
jgi:hypothetical protein